jgi:hypothetical protein
MAGQRIGQRWELDFTLFIFPEKDSGITLFIFLRDGRVGVKSWGLDRSHDRLFIICNLSTAIEQESTSCDSVELSKSSQLANQLMESQYSTR